MAPIQVPIAELHTKFGPVELLLHSPESITARNDAAHSRPVMAEREQFEPLKVNGVLYGLGGTPLFPCPDGSGAWMVGSRSTYEQVKEEDAARGIVRGDGPGDDRYALHQARWAARVSLSRIGSFDDPTPAATEAMRVELERAVTEWCKDNFAEGCALLDESRAYRRADDAGHLARDLERLLSDQWPDIDARANTIGGVAGVVHKLDVARRGIGAAAVTLREVERGER